MYLRLLLLMHTAVLFTINFDVSECTDPGNETLQLKVGKEVMIPEVVEETEKEREKEANSTPTTDVVPAKESSDKQGHGSKKKDGKNIESGMPPKYPLKAESAETSAHDNEIGGCRDHPRAGLVCSKCENGNKCFPAEHESYTYSYCRRSCRHCDPSTSSFHTFWRLRAQSEFEPTWMLQQVEFYADPQEKISLVDDPEKAYASSVYTGYKPSFAFDNNNGSAWYPSGWGIHDNNDDWIAYEFTVAVRVHGVRMVVDKDHATAQPKKVIVEASDKMYGPFQKKWTIYNTDYSVDKVYKLLECDVLWRRFEVEDGAWCFRLIAKLETWEGARKACEIEGGDLATVANKEEQRFITDEVGLCSHTWFGLSHTNEGYYWNDGSNSTYRNWREQLSYSDVQKQTLNCAAMDPEGTWYNFHCSNKFYFICKKRLVPRAEPRPDLTDNAWPYPPEVPPLIFFAPNVTVPVINSKNLEPGIFPDANGKVEGEDQEEDITLSDLFYEQTVEHLKEKGLKPSEEIEADENQEETDFTQELNKIAINTSPGDYQNETKGDNTKNDTASAHKQEQEFENIPNKEANNAVTNAASADAPKPKPKHKEKPVPPPPEEGDGNGDDNSYPEIVHGKPKEDSLKNKNRQGKDVPKGHTGPKDKASSSMMAAEPGAAGSDEQPGTGKQQVQDEGKAKRRKRKKPTHKPEETGDAGKDKGQSESQANSQYFYVPNQSGSFTLMKMLTPPNNQTGGPQPQTGSAASQNTSAAASTPASDAKNLAAEPGTPEQSKAPEGAKTEGSASNPSPIPGPATAGSQPQTIQPPQYFYMQNAQGQMTLMKTIQPNETAGASPGNQVTNGPQGQLPKQVENSNETAAATAASNTTQIGAQEQPDKSAEIGKTDDEQDNSTATPQTFAPAAPAAPAAAAQQNTSAPPHQQGAYFYVPNQNGTYTLMKSLTPSYAGKPPPATAAAATPQHPPPPPPPPKEGDDDDDSEDSVGGPPDTKKGQHKKTDSFANKDIPMQPFTGPLGGPSLAQQNISKSSRKKIKVLQPLESAAHGEEISIMGETNKIHKKKVLTRHLIHTPKAKMSAKKKRRNRHLNHMKSKEHDSMSQNNDDGGNADVRHITSHPKHSKVVKQDKEDEDEDSPDIEESGSGSGTQVETDNADIFPEKEEFWSR